MKLFDLGDYIPVLAAIDNAKLDLILVGGHAVRRFRDATLKEECKTDYPHALQAMLKAIDEAEDLIRQDPAA